LAGAVNVGTNNAASGTTEGSQNQEVFEANAPCNKGDNAYIALGMKQVRVLC